jgi:hypothetical protein
MDKIISNENNCIEEYYLINNNWIKTEIDLKEKEEKNIKDEESIEPKTENISKNPNFAHLKFPYDFGLIEKRNNETIIKNLVGDDETINIEDISSKIFFVKWLQSYENKVYLGIIVNKNKSVIYFYLFDKNKYSFEFLLQFYEESIIYEEIKTKIKTKGIGLYLIEMGIDFSNNDFHDLYNDKMEMIGLCFNKKKNDIILESLIPKNIQNEDNYGFINKILIGLINLEPFKKIFLNKKNMVDKNSKYTQYFYELIQNLYYVKKKSKENLLDKFVEGIKQQYKNNDIFKNIEELTKFLLINLQNEQKREIDGKKYIYLETELNKQLNDKDLDNFYKENNSFIQESLFFALETCFKCNNGNCGYQYGYYTIKFALVFHNVQLNNKNKDDKISIKTIFDNLNKDIKCKKCSCRDRLLKKFKKCPNYLIIIIDDKNINDCLFNLEEIININDYCSFNSNDDVRYELIYFVLDCSTSYLKSNKKWHEYNDKDVKYDVNIKNINSKFPSFLIYKKR